MPHKFIFVICLQVCLFQIALTQYASFGPFGIGSGPQTGAPCGIGSLGNAIGPNPGLTQSSLGVTGPLGPGGPVYGGTGSGAVAVAGELPVAGSTLVTGQVPVVGGVQFSGTVPAAGIITISGSCSCGAPYGY